MLLLDVRVHENLLEHLHAYKHSASSSSSSPFRLKSIYFQWKTASHRKRKLSPADPGVHHRGPESPLRLTTPVRRLPTKIGTTTTSTLPPLRPSCPRPSTELADTVPSRFQSLTTCGQVPVLDHRARGGPVSECTGSGANVRPPCQAGSSLQMHRDRCQCLDHGGTTTTVS